MKTMFTLRLDQELLDLIKKLAEKQKRSINNQIIFILQNYIDSNK